MGRETSRRGTHLALRFGALTAVAVGAAACSSEAVRLSESPGASPYAAAPANQMVAQPAPVGRVERQPLPQYQPAISASAATAAPTATSEVTGTVRTGGHWDWQGGTPVVVAQGETIAAIAHRHNVPAHEILRANGLNASATLQAGQRLVIPRYVADGGSAKLAHAALPRHPASPVAAAPPPRRAGGAGRARRRARRDAVLDRAKASDHHSRARHREQHDAGNAAQGRHEAQRPGADRAPRRTKTASLASGGPDYRGDRQTARPCSRSSPPSNPPPPRVSRRRRPRRRRTSPVLRPRPACRRSAGRCAAG